MLCRLGVVWVVRVVVMLKGGVVWRFVLGECE